MHLCTKIRKNMLKICMYRKIKKYVNEIFSKTIEVNTVSCVVTLNGTPRRYLPT